MQHLMKLTLAGAPVWRLVALDGKADLSHAAALICAAFGYRGLDCAFKSGDERVGALTQGQLPGRGAMETLDAYLSRTRGDFSFIASDGVSVLSHFAKLMRSDEKLACLIPSCIVGSGAVPPEGPYDPGYISAYAQDDANLTLDIKSATNRMRALGSVRPSLEAALGAAGIAPILFREQ